MRKPPVVPAATVEYFGPGEVCTDYQPGDLILVRHHGFVAAAIRFGERLRCRGDKAKYSAWNHAMTAVGAAPFGSAEEQTAHGGKLSRIEDYVALDYAVVHVTNASLEQRDAAVAVAEWYAGISYGWFSILGDVLFLLTGLPIGLAWGQSAVCSADAAAAQRCLGLIPDKPDPAVLPSDLARFFDVGLPRSHRPKKLRFWRWPRIPDDEHAPGRAA